MANFNRGMEIYDRQGNLISFWEWAELRRDFEKSIVAKSKIGDVEVSTVWLGLNHNFSEYGPPIIFETMVFGGPLSGEQERYSTEEEARKGHEEWVKKVKGDANGRIEL